ncbi:MAG: acyl-ACP--UDP-N-acetylglucosamine O-acyltransferase [Pseudomonadota bacterium]|nr:acyl-ACP--UDP-N-acetylglucosamine O-acyltransferase [Pseudomonadota bacterium]
MTLVHETAIIAKNANLDSNVEIGPYAIIGEDVSIGSGTIVGPHSVIKGETKIGENNRIFQFASIGDDPQDKKYNEEKTRLVIGNGNTIREYCTLNRGTIQDAGVTTLGDNNWLMAYVHIAHDCQVGNETIFANAATLGGHVKVGDYVIFGGFSAAHQFSRIGAHAFIANNCAVTRDVPPYLMASGRPAEPRGINTEGLKRRGFTREQNKVIKDVFRLLYRQGLRLEEAQGKINAMASSHDEVKIFAEFLNHSERGIIR